VDVSTTVRTDTSCGVFFSLGGLDPNAINRFVVGEDQAPRALTADEAARELGDPFATSVLLKGSFPRTGEDALAALKAAAGNGSPLAEQRSFVLGEGSQLPPDIESVDRSMRFLVATQFGADGPDVIVSAFDPTGSDVELMAWDRTSSGFNYYRTVGPESAWVFAGNSRHALFDPTQGKGPFESHASGALLMKELKIPWLHWHSFETDIEPTVFAEGDGRRTHAWFNDKDGAEVCEVDVAIPSIERWGRARFDRIIAEGGTVSDPRRVLKQVLGTPTVNLTSSRAESGDPDAKGGVALPGSFFVSSDALARPPLGLQSPPTFNVPTGVYRASLQTFGFALRDNQGFDQPGDTHFAFFVPERALEDDVALREAIRIGLITPRLAAALLMVDFPNPIFSDRRERLLDHTPDSAVISGGASGFSDEMANRILAAAENTPDDSPEREFAQRWGVGEEFAFSFNSLLSAYYAAVTAQLATQEGFDAYVRLAEARRRQAKASTPIVREFPLLFPATNIPNAARMMKPDGTVLEIDG
jgi:hypothetical protein